MKQYYKNIDGILYVYNGIINYKLNRYDLRKTVELFDKHDKSYIDDKFLSTLTHEFFLE